ncbi:hypothetical protein D3C72_505360 [compost metagenome]
MDQVHACAKLVTLPEAPTGVQRGANLRIRSVIDANFGLRRVARVFWLKVDHPADAGACRAVHQGVGPFEDLNTINHLRIDHLTRQHAGESAKSHVVAVEFQAANAIAFRTVAVALHRLHARIVGDHIGNGFGLLIFHQLRGVADDVKRHVHRVLLAEHPHAATVGDLSVKEGGHQLIAARFEIAGRRRLHHEGLFFWGLRRKGGVRNRADGERQQRSVHSGVVHD